MSEDFVAWAKGRNAAYTRRRSNYRRSHPDRAHGIETATYVAPEELRPKPREGADE